MHGLINWALQRFACDAYGTAVWAAACRAAALPVAEFEPMLSYDPAVTDRVIDALAAVLQRPRAALLEDVGTHLVSAPRSAGVRRLLRFSGNGFEDFLHTLDELPDRARLAVPDLELPRLHLLAEGPDRYRLTCRSRLIGFGHVLVGVLRAMADDYGALVTLDHRGEGPVGEVIAITLHVASFAAGRDFDLGARTG